MLGNDFLRHRPSPSNFVAGAQSGAGATTIAVPGAAAAGDMAMVLTAGTGVSGGAGGWSALTGGAVNVFVKKLVTGDLGATLTVAGASTNILAILIYRGGDVVSLLSGASGVSPLSYAGLTKSRNDRCLIAIFVEGTIGAIDIPVMTPSSFTSRGGFSFVSSSVSLWCVYDAIAYTDNAAMSWTWTSGGSQSVFFLEIT